WITYARIVRGEALSLRQREFVEAARALGATDRYLVWRHILPNVLPPVTVVATFSVARTIIAEASLSFLGLGIPPPAPSGGGVLGGGSNLWVADEGVDGLVVKIALRGTETREVAGAVELTAAAGEPWDDLVRQSVERGWAGLECLSGIPGLVGATPMQNVGAYGQEVSDTVVAVRALDTTTGEALTLSPAECGFAYRDSAFKSRELGRYVVLAVTYRLRPGAAPTLGYADVERAVAARGLTAPTLADVRASVLAIRRAKSMVLDAGDPNRRSCGSFFTNPIVTPDAAA